MCISRPRKIDADKETFNFAALAIPPEDKRWLHKTLVETCHGLSVVGMMGKTRNNIIIKLNARGFKYLGVSSNLAFLSVWNYWISLFEWLVSCPTSSCDQFPSLTSVNVCEVTCHMMLVVYLK